MKKEKEENPEPGNFQETPMTDVTKKRNSRIRYFWVFGRLRYSPNPRRFTKHAMECNNTVEGCFFSLGSVCGKVSRAVSAAGSGV
jgi:hypothetical protein